MLRVLSLSLALVATVATTAHATSVLDVSGRGIESALSQTAATAGKGARSERRPGEAVQLQVGGALALAQPSLRARLERAGDWGLAPYLLGHGHAAAATPPVVVRWLDLRGSKPALAYAVTDSLSLGLRYSFQRGEDLNFKAARSGSLHEDYANHRVLLRAQWEF